MVKNLKKILSILCVLVMVAVAFSAVVTNVSACKGKEKEIESLNPDVAISSEGIVHIVWQENLTGNYETYYANNLTGAYKTELNTAVQKVQSLIANTSDKKLKSELEKALKELNKTLVNATANDYHHSFKHLQHAVERFDKKDLKYGEIITALVNSARDVTKVNILYREFLNISQDHTTKAWEKFYKGLEKVNEEKYDKAVNEFRKAFKEAYKIDDDCEDEECSEKTSVGIDFGEIVRISYTDYDSKNPTIYLNGTIHVGWTETIGNETHVYYARSQNGVSWWYFDATKQASHYLSYWDIDLGLIDFGLDLPRIKDRLKDILGILERIWIWIRCHRFWGMIRDGTYTLISDPWLDHYTVYTVVIIDGHTIHIPECEDPPPDGDGDGDYAADLTVTDISFSPTYSGYVFTTDTITITATIMNQGDATATGITVRFWDNGVQIDGDKTIAYLDPYGATKTRYVSCTLSAGSHSIRAMVDPDNTIPDEGNEYNNELTEYITALDPSGNDDGDSLSNYNEVMNYYSYKRINIEDYIYTGTSGLTDALGYQSAGSNNDGSGGGDDPGGAGVTFGYINGNNIPDALFMVVDAPSGSDNFRYRIGYDIDMYGSFSSWSSVIISGYSAGGDKCQGGGVSFCDVNNNGKPDAIFMMIDNPSGENNYRYRVAFDIDSNGYFSSWSGVKGYQATGANDGQGGDVAVCDINGNGIPDVLFMMLDAPSGDNNYRYKIGYDINSNGDITSWSAVKGYTSAGSGGSQGAGAAFWGMTFCDVNYNNKPDILLMTIDNYPSEDNNYRYKIGYDIDANGDVSSWGDVAGWISVGGWDSQGGGVTIWDINGNGIPDALFMQVDNPPGDNQYRYRIVYDLSPYVFYKLDTRYLGYNGKVSMPVNIATKASYKIGMYVRSVYMNNVAVKMSVTKPDGTVVGSSTHNIQNAYTFSCYELTCDLNAGDYYIKIEQTGKGYTLYDYVLIKKQGLNPLSSDTDGDGLSDGDEVGLGTYPLNSDTDGDGLTDGAEVNTQGTNPLNTDTDGDGWSDYYEIYSSASDAKVANPLPYFGFSWHLKPDWIDESSIGNANNNYGVPNVFQQIYDNRFAPTHGRTIRFDMDVMADVDANGNVKQYVINRWTNLCLWAYENNAKLFPVLGGTGSYDTGEETAYPTKAYYFVKKLAETVCSINPNAYKTIVAYQVENEMNHEIAGWGHHVGWSKGNEIKLLSQGSKQIRQAETDAGVKTVYGLDYTPLSINFALDVAWSGGNAYNDMQWYFWDAWRGPDGTLYTSDDGVIDILGLDFYPGSWTDNVGAVDLKNIVVNMCNDMGVGGSLNWNKKILVTETGHSDLDDSGEQGAQQNYYTELTNYMKNYYWTEGGKNKGFLGILWYELFDEKYDHGQIWPNDVERNFGIVETVDWYGSSGGYTAGENLKLAWNWLAYTMTP